LVNHSSYRENIKVAAMLPLSATTKEVEVHLKNTSVTPCYIGYSNNFNIPPDRPNSLADIKG
jgi:hypothetical protein